jgi:hypothetical protein
LSEAATVSLAETERWLGRAQPFAGIDEVSRNDIRRKLEVSLWSMPAYWMPGQPPAWTPDARESPGGIRMEVPIPFAKGVNAASEW